LNIYLYLILYLGSSVARFVYHKTETKKKNAEKG